MARNISLPILLLVLLFSSFGRRGALGNNDEDNWIEPNAWAREAHLTKTDHAQNAVGKPRSSADTDDLLAGQHTDNELAAFYYKKFVKFLFNREKLVHDNSTGQYKRSLHFTLRAEQLDKLEKLNDMRDIDAIVSEIFSKAKTLNKFNDDGSDGFGKMGLVGSLFLDIFKDLLQLLQIPEVQFLLIVLGLIMMGWFCHRSYGIGIITMIIGAIISFGYMHTYLECNRKLEAARMLAVLEKQQPASQDSWYSPIIRFFSSSEATSKQSRQEFIKQSGQLNLPFCRPDHVFIQYVNDLFLTQLEVLLEKCTSTIITLKDNLSFPFNYLAAIMLVCVIVYTLKLTFKYILSPRAWAVFFHSNTLPTQQQQPQLQTHATEDRLTGDNLRRILHLIGSGGPNIIVNNDPSMLTTNSGVQEVIEQLEAAKSASSDSSDSGSANTSREEITKKSTLNNNFENDGVKNANKKSDVRMEDLGEEDKEA